MGKEGAFEYQLLRDCVSDLKGLDRSKLGQYLDYANAYATYTTTQKGALSSPEDQEQMKKWLSDLVGKQ
ncbi:MAG: hypothetical protein ACI32N_05045 [Bulleidia sp.]